MKKWWLMLILRLLVLGASAQREYKYRKLIQFLDSSHNNRWEYLCYDGRGAFRETRGWVTCQMVTE